MALAIQEAEHEVSQRPLVLLLDDEPAVVSALRKALRHEPFDVAVATTVADAFEILENRIVDVVVSDERMPTMSGSQFLSQVRDRNPDIGRIMLTGHASPEATMLAINEAQVYRYHVKPCPPQVLAQSINEAIELRAKRVAVPAAPNLDELNSQLTTALERVWAALQPIVRADNSEVYAYEALIRSDDPILDNAVKLIDAASSLGRAIELDQTMRAAVAYLIPLLPAHVSVFVNLFPESLRDTDLYDKGAPLSAHAHRVVLEVTEREALDRMAEVDSWVARVRERGYRIAVDDLGAGYASLNSLATLEPEVVKFDAFLTRGIHQSPTRSSLVSSFIRYCRDVGTYSLAEGVETKEEADCLRSLGCDLLQGYYFGRPARYPA